MFSWCDTILVPVGYFSSIVNIFAATNHVSILNSFALFKTHNSDKHLYEHILYHQILI
jgi:hypothetical protein